MCDYNVITVCSRLPSEPYYCLSEYAKSLKMESVFVIDGYYCNYGGLGSKPRGVYKAIKEGLINKKYIIFTDCWDFVFSDSPNTLFRNYLTEYPNSPLVISAEKNCFPDDLKNEFDVVAGFGEVNSPYKYLNSGMIVGETEALLAVLESMDAKNIPNDYWDAEKNCQINPNDQFYYQQEFIKQPVKIDLDYDQKLCCTLHQTTLDDLDFKFSRIRNKITDSFPCSWHFNGSAKTDGCREKILDHLNLLQ